MKKAGAIIRVSTARQLAGTSPEKQREAIEELANEQGYSIEDQHNWTIAESGSLRERTGYQTALHAASNGEISRVYVFSIDRLGRNLLEMLQFLRDLDDQAVDCWEAEGHRRLSWDDFTIQVLGAVAGKERRDILRRSMDGKKRAVASGKYPGGNVPYGYFLNRETKKLELDPEEAKTIQMIFEWCADERLSALRIADRLNALELPTYKQRRFLRKYSGEKGISPPNDKWTSAKVHNILIKRAYTGLSYYGAKSTKIKPEDKIPMVRPQVISESLYQRVTELRRTLQITSPKHAKNKYLLRGLIKCRNCGLTYCGTTWNLGSQRVQKTYYVCNGSGQWKKLGRERCPSKALRADSLEPFVWEDVKNFILDPEIVLKQLTDNQRPEDENLSEQIASVEAQIDELHRQEENTLIIAAQSQEVNVPALDAVLAELRRSQNTLEAHKRHLEGRLSRGDSLEKELFGIAERLSSLQGQIHNASFDEKRRAISELVKGIQVSTETIQGKKTAIIEVTYRFEEPLPPVVYTPQLDTSILNVSTHRHIHR